MICFHIQAQENYQKGTILTAAGEEISGFIDYRNWSKNPTSINFKKNLSASRETYTPSGLKQFEVAGEKYITATLQVDQSPIRTNELTFKVKSNFIKITVFLQTLFEGKKSLYYLKDQKSKVHFFIDRNGTLEWLRYKKYLKNQDNQKLVYEDKAFVGQLILYFPGETKIKSRLDDIKYKKHSLIKLFNIYYSQKENQVSFKKSEDKDFSVFGAFAGVSSTAVSFESFTSFEDLVNAEYSRSIFPTAGIFHELFFARNFNKISLKNELMYTSFKVDNTNTAGTTYTELGFAYIKLNSMLKYNLSNKKNTLFFNAGVSNGLIIYSTNYKRKEVLLGVIELKALEGVRKFEYGLILGIGSQISKLSIEMRVEFSSGLSPFASLTSKVNRIFLLAGYKFN